MSDVNNQFLISIAIILLGFLFKKSGIINARDGDGLAKLVVNLTVPAVVIAAFKNLKIDSSLLFIPVISITFGVLIALIAVFVFRREDRKTRGMLSMMAPGGNLSMFGYPLVGAIWGLPAVRYLGMFDMGNIFSVFGVSYFIAARFAEASSDHIDYHKIFAKIAGSIPLLVYALTLLLKILGLNYPAPITAMATIISKANSGLALCTLGIFLDFDFDRASLVKMGRVLALRYGVGLLAGLIIMLFPVEPLFKYTMMVGFILPIGFIAIPYSVEFDYDRKFVGTLTNLTIVISILLIWAVALLANIPS